MDAFKLDEMAKRYVEVSDGETVTAEELITFAREHDAVIGRAGQEEFLVSFDGILRGYGEKELRSRLPSKQ